MKYHESKDKATHYLELVDHMINVTFKAVSNPKLMITMIENLFLSMVNSMSAILHYEREKGNIPSFNENYDAKFVMFTQKCANKHSIEKKHIETMNNLKKIIIERQKSPTEFQRGKSWVICSSDYNMKILTINKIKEYWETARKFKEKMVNIVNDRIVI